MMRRQKGAGFTPTPFEKRLVMQSSRKRSGRCALDSSNIATSQKKMWGFTIIEMLVTIGVLTILGGLLILYSRSGEQTSTLLREAAKMTSDVNRAKNLAITTVEFTTKDGEKINPCGYGVYFDQPQNQYIIFADPSSDCQTSDHLRASDGSADVETILLTNPLKFSSANIEQVFFLAPDPTIYFQPPEITEANIQFRAPNGASMGVRINQAGQVSTF